MTRTISYFFLDGGYPLVSDEQQRIDRIADAKLQGLASSLLDGTRGVMDGAQLDCVRQLMTDFAFPAWERVLDITFVPAASTADSELRIGFSSALPNDVVPAEGFTSPTGLIVFSSSLKAGWRAFEPGGKLLIVMLHEIGHWLGLAHPGSVSPEIDEIYARLGWTPVPTTDRLKTIMNAYQATAYAATPMSTDIGMTQARWGGQSRF